MPKSFGLNARGALHALLNMAEHLDYVFLYPEPKLYGTEYISGAERAKFLEWYQEQKEKISCKKQRLLA